MSDFMREALPIMFMYGCVLALGPFVGIAMWMAFDGDRERTHDAPVAEPAATQVTPVTNQLEAREALGAA